MIETVSFPFVFPTCTLPMPALVEPHQLESAEFPVEAVDYEAIAGDQRAVFLGEIHHNSSIRHEVTEALPLFKRMGFTHLAMEMFHSAVQRHLDFYATLTNEAARSYERQRLIEGDIVFHRRTQYYDDPNAFPPESGIYHPYVDIVDRAVESGLKVIGIEWCRYDGEPLMSHREKYYAEMGLTPERLEALQGEDGYHGSIASELYTAVFERHGPIRNHHAATVLARLLKQDVDARVVVLGGRKHYGRMHDIRDNFTLNRLLTNMTGFQSSVVYYAPADERRPTVWTYLESPNISLLLAGATDAQGLGKRRFMVRVPGSGIMDTPDYIIHIPAAAPVSHHPL